MATKTNDGRGWRIASLGSFDLGFATPETKLAFGTSEFLARAQYRTAHANRTGPVLAVLPSCWPFARRRKKELRLASARCIFHPPGTGGSFLPSFIENCHISRYSGRSSAAHGTT